MDKASIFARTAKGEREVAGATRDLPQELRRVLDAIDGRAPLEALRGTLANLSAAELDAALATLMAEDFIREAEVDTTDAADAAAHHDDESLRQAQALRAKIKARREGAERSTAEAEAGAAADEEQTRREAEEQARQLAEEQARQDAAAQAHREVEEEARRQAADIVRREAEAQARWLAEEQAWREAEEKNRTEQEAAARMRADARAAAQESKAGKEFLRRWGMALALGFLALLTLGLVTVHLVSFDGQIPPFEKALAAQFRQPVKIEALRLSLLPHPQLRLERVAIGADGQIRIPRVSAAGDLGQLFGAHKVFDSLELDAPRLNEEGLGWILFGQPAAGDTALGRITAHNATLESKNLSLPPFDATLELDADGAWKTIAVRATDKNLNLELARQGESLRIDLNAKSFKLPFGAALTLEDLVAKGTADRAGLVLTEFKGYAYGGTLSGNAALKWDSGWSLAGQLTAKQIDTARLLPELLDGARLEGTAAYAMQAAQAAQLFAAPRLEGSFGIARGTLLGVDLGRILQGGGTRGDTMFTDLAASFVHEGGATQLRQLRLNQGGLAASGTVDVDAEKNVRGRLTLNLKLSTEQLSTRLGLSGTLKHLEWRR